MNSHPPGETPLSQDLKGLTQESLGLGDEAVETFLGDNVPFTDGEDDTLTLTHHPGHCWNLR